VHGQQRLVGRHDMLAIGDGLHDHFLGHAVTADQFNDDVDFRIVDQRKGIIGHAGSFTGDLLGQLNIFVGHGRNANRTAGAASNFFRVALENSVQVPPPTVPMPIRPTLMGFISKQSKNLTKRLTRWLATGDA
jgi:hypothetical protein